VKSKSYKEHFKIPKMPNQKLIFTTFPLSLTTSFVDHGKLQSFAFSSLEREPLPFKGK